MPPAKALQCARRWRASGRFSERMLCQECGMKGVMWHRIRVAHTVVRVSLHDYLNPKSL